MSLLKKQTFVLTSLEINSNKFWTISLYPNKVVTHFGRMGQTGETSTKEFSSQVLAEKFYASKIRDKTKVKPGRRDSYTEINILSDNAISKPAGKHLSDLAVSQIQTSSDEVRQLIRFLSDVNIHNITSSTSIRYNLAEGSFTTPLGLVDQSCLTTAKQLLEKISEYVLRGEFSVELNKLVDTYLRFLPQDLGSSHQKIQLKNVFGTPDLLQKQLDTILSLEAAISSAIPLQQEEKVFETTLDLVSDNSIIDYVREKFGNNSSKVKNIYQVNIAPVVNQWLAYGVNLGNHTQLFHGTSPAHVLSILKCGLIIPERSYNGSNHGRGIYFSDRSSKSLGYTQFNQRENNRVGYMFLSEVALGNTLYDTGSKIPTEYNSRWAYKNSGESQIIVYRLGQANLLFLCELFS